jgi:hypothetical protein
MQDFVASFLEAAGPLTLLGAQVVYFSQPYFDGLDQHGHLRALADMLEDSTKTYAFIDFLREATLT